MSTTTNAPQHPHPLVQPFPEPGPLVRLAYRELNIAATGTPEQATALGDTRLLPRPWDPGTCRNPELRQQVWSWLEAVVIWLNTEYVWDVNGMIPTCWPLHPHLIHDIAVLADQRRHAGTALSSDAMEEWHRYALPALIDRMRARLANHCEVGHQPWPLKAATRGTQTTQTKPRAQSPGQATFAIARRRHGPAANRGILDQCRHSRTGEMTYTREPPHASV